MTRKTGKLHLREVSVKDLLGIVERTKSAALNEQEHANLKAAMDTLAFLTTELQSKRVSIDRLRKMLFGAKTEKAARLIGKRGKKASPDKSGDKEKLPGHGRNGAGAYNGAEKIKVAHPSLQHGEQCGDCEKGRVYTMNEPAVLVRVTGMAPLGAIVYECDRLRCNLCGEVFTAPSPDGVGEKKYDETATSMTAMLKYGSGVPFYRIQKLQKGFGIPLPATTQWEIVRDGAKLVVPAHDEMIRQAAQGEVLYNDDTTMKVLSLTKAERANAAEDKQTNARTGVFTSGIVSTREGRKIALFFTGVKHAGENLSDVLARRMADLPPPIQMCDALSRNTTGDFKSILSNCNAHARRRFADVIHDFPDECRYVIEILRDVYRNDALARSMSSGMRLHFHQAQSGPLMERLEQWLREQIDEHKVEPNSGLGEAIVYMRKHWEQLTLFLHVAGAPLDNNICERAIKKVILHRKNALFYKTLAGAHVGDIFMSLIHTAELNGVGPFEYLVALQRHAKRVREQPADWMPWNYLQTLAQLAPLHAPPA